MRRTITGLVFTSIVGLAACGSDTPSSGTPALCTLGTTATVTISSTGVSPKIACVVPTGQVTFRNTDTVAHSLAPDVAAGCALLAVGPIAAGGNSVVTFPSVLSCAYHDVDNATSAAYQGSLTVAVPGSGGGY